MEGIIPNPIVYSSTEALSGRLPQVVQLGPSCTAASVKMVLRYYGVKAPSHRKMYNRARDRAGYDDDTAGLSLDDAAQYVRSLGLSARAVEGDMRMLRKYTAPRVLGGKDTPVIVSVRTAGGGTHSIVVYRVTPFSVLYANPHGYKVRMPIFMFKKKWGSRDYDALLISRPENYSKAKEAARKLRVGRMRALDLLGKSAYYLTLGLLFTGLGVDVSSALSSLGASTDFHETVRRFMFLHKDTAPISWSMLGYAAISGSVHMGIGMTILGAAALGVLRVLRHILRGG